MTSEADEQRRAAGIEIAELFADHECVRLGRAEDDRRPGRASNDDRQPGDRSGRGAAAPGVLLRHARPAAQPGRGRRPRATDPGGPRRHRRQAAARRPRRASPGAPPVAFLQRRGGHAARADRRVLRVAEGTRPRAPRSATRCAADSPLRKLFTKDQRAFYKEHAPADIDLDALQLLGPTFILKSVFQATSITRRFVAEAWFYPDGTRILELSTRCLPSEAMTVARDARQYLEEHGITVGAGTQQTKTKTALEFFSAQLREAGGARSTDIALGGRGDRRGRRGPVAERRRCRRDRPGTRR